MNPEEIKTFVAAASEALWLEQNAQTFDKEVELLRGRFTRCE